MFAAHESYSREASQTYDFSYNPSTRPLRLYLVSLLLYHDIGLIYLQLRQESRCRQN